MSSAFETALDYAEHGLRVFPAWTVRADGRCACGSPDCRDLGKHPIGMLVPNGSKGATTDEITLLGWNDRRPDANWAMNTNDAAVIDIDAKSGADPVEVVAAYELGRARVWTGEAGEPDEDYPDSLPGVRGMHVYHVGGCPTVGAKTCPVRGCEVKGYPNGYAMVPGSRHPSGVAYEFVDERRPWTAERLAVPGVFKPQPAPHSDSQRTLGGSRQPAGPLVEALRAIPAEDYVEELTGRRPGRNGKIECPFHSDWSPSFHIYPGDGGWFCFQCTPRPGRSTPGRGGDIFALAADCWGLDYREEFPEIIRRLRRLFGRNHGED